MPSLVSRTCLFSGEGAKLSTAFKGTSTSFSAETSPDTYAYEWVPSAQPSVGSNVGKAVTNAFYLINSLHDILYRYGFT